MSTTNRRYIVDAVEAILEDIFGRPTRVPFGESPSGFLDPEQLELFKQLAEEEFLLDQDTLGIDDAATWAQLIHEIQLSYFD